MARRLRLLARAVLYHVIVLGNHRQKTFLNQSNYQAYLERLGRYRKRLGITVYAYGLMPIMFISWSRPVLSRYPDLCKSCNNLTRSILIVSTVQSVIYSKAATNKAIVGDKDEYLLSLVRYIYLNPVRANMVHRVDEYPYSGHQSYVEGRVSEVLEPERVTFSFASWLFLKLLGIIYLIAFWSLSTQILGLVGEAGILPAGPFLQSVSQRVGPERFLILPTVFWVDAGNAFLQGVTLAGVALSFGLALGFFDLPTCVCCGCFTCLSTLSVVTFSVFSGISCFSKPASWQFFSRPSVLYGSAVPAPSHRRSSFTGFSAGCSSVWYFLPAL